MKDKLDKIIELLSKIERSLSTDPLPIVAPIFKPVIKQKYLILLDAGHGGLDPKTGDYTTAPSKMYKHDGLTFFEGVYNRLVLKRLTGLLTASGYEFKVLSHEWRDNSLRGRVTKANKLHKEKSSILFSLHGNAANNLEAHGIEVFTSKGQTKSDSIADQQIKNMQALFPDVRFRLDITDGDLDKEADFYVLNKTRCPAILIESGFFTNYEQAKLMLSDEWIFNVALATFNTIGWANTHLK